MQLGTLLFSARRFLSLIPRPVDFFSGKMSLPANHPIAGVIEMNERLTFDAFSWFDELISIIPFDSDASRRDELLACKLVSMKHFKDESASEHEYLVFRVKTTFGDLREIRVERSVVTPTSTDGMGPGLGKKMLFSSAVSSPVFIAPSAPARDKITIYHPDHIPIYLRDIRSRLLYAVTFSNNKVIPTILDLAAISSVISSISRNYRIFTYMCYWYSGMILRAVLARFPGYTLENTPDAFRAGRWHRMKVINEKGQYIWSGLPRDSNKLPPGANLPSIACALADTLVFAAQAEIVEEVKKRHRFVLRSDVTSPKMNGENVKAVVRLYEKKKSEGEDVMKEMQRRNRTRVRQLEEEVEFWKAQAHTARGVVSVRA